MKPAIATWSRIVHCIRIVPVSGTTIYLTEYPYDLPMSSGQVYVSDSGYEFSGLNVGTNFAPSSIDLSGFVNTAGVTKADLADGVYDNARINAFVTDWSAPVEDEEPIGLALFGKTHLVDNQYRAELMMLVDALNQSVGDSYSASCQKKFGGQETSGCTVDLGPITVVGTITAVTDRYNFQDSGRAEALDYFGEGTITFTSGANNGLKAQEIKTYLANGSIEIFEAMPYDVEIGDTYSLVPGCKKRLEDCRDKWNNILNFGGFSWIPTENQAQARGSK